MLKKLPGRRVLVRFAGYSLALLLALGGAAYSGYALAAENRRLLDLSYRRALSQLTDYVGTLDMNLKKGLYATSARHMQGLAAQLLKDSSCAKLALEQLPVAGGMLVSTNKFLSQVGSFCGSLTDRMAGGKPVTDEQHRMLSQLSDCAREALTELNYTEMESQEGRLWLGEQRLGALSGAGNADSWNTGAPQNLNGWLLGVEDGLTGMPELLYDGPFSDAIPRLRPRMTADAAEVTVTAAREKAVETIRLLELGVTLTHDGEMEGVIPCYTFTGGGFTIAVTKAGGFVCSFLYSRQINEAALDPEAAAAAADEWLEKLGYAEMQMRYYSANCGITVANYAAVQNSITLYADLVKIGVACDDGRLVSFDATGYLMNHFKRSAPSINITQQQARERLSKFLRPTAAALALIPTNGIGEVLCHEFLCDGEGERVLVYVNCETGEEQEILILLEDETGVLVM
ncbi:MAG: germination protein YpeB [Oscillospiraceae bacterium]|nr:germination protein YpeB [Oscillospiraceae bacterium]